MTGNFNRKSKLTLEQDDEIAKRYVDGESRYALGKEYGVTIETINKILQVNGVTPRSLSESSAARKVPRSRWSEIKQLYLEGKNPEEIGEVFNIHKCSI